MRARHGFGKLLAGAAAALGPGVALACAFHGYAPAPSVVDRLLESRHIVLARADPADAFAYQPMTAIRGTLADVEIPYLVDSVTRERLSGDGESSVLFARDEMTGGWEPLVFLDEDLRGVFGGVFPRLDAWEVSVDAERFQHFAAHHQSDNDELRRLALLELDLAPYEVLRGLEFDPDARNLIASFGARGERDFWSIKLLLIGLSGDPEAAAFLEAGLRDAPALPDRPLIGAYATAYIELVGPPAVERVRTDILGHPDLDMESRERALEALVLQHLHGPEPVRAAIDEVIGDVLLEHPELAGPVARQFGGYGDWSQAGRLDTLRRGGRLTSIVDHITVSQYVEIARQATQGTSSQ